MKTGLFRTQQRGKGEAPVPPALPQQALPLWSLFPVCLPGKGHVTNPEGNADIIVSLSHMCSLPPSQPALPALHSGIHPAASPAPGPFPQHSRLLPLIFSFSCHTFLCFLFPCRLSPRWSWMDRHTYTHTTHFGPPFLFPSTSLSSSFNLFQICGHGVFTVLKIHFLFLYRFKLSKLRKKKKEKVW